MRKLGFLAGLLQENIKQVCLIEFQKSSIILGDVRVTLLVDFLEVFITLIKEGNITFQNLIINSFFAGHYDVELFFARLEPFRAGFDPSVSV